MPPRKLPANHVLREMYESGLSAPEIAEQLGNVSPITVSCMLKKIGVKMRGPAEADALSRSRGRKRVTSFWTGKTQPPEMVEKRVSKIRGDKHYLWRGGKARRPYRQMIEKDECAVCGSTEQLLIHHKDGDHYNNVLSNLEVRCSPCHTSDHKSEYWEAVRNGEKPPPEMAKGEQNGQSKITEETVKEIFRLRAEGLFQWQIGERVGLSQTHVGRILRGDRWGHVQDK